MSISFQDINDILQIVKECKDTQLHIDTGDMQLTIVRGQVQGGALDLATVSTAVKSENHEQAATAIEQNLANAEASGQLADSPLPEQTNAAEDIDESEEGLVSIKASVTSVFYRCPSPDEPPFVEVGDEVTEETVLCLLEVMKCYRQVTAEVSGTVAKVCIDSDTMVEEGTVMFLIRPNQ